MRVGLDTYTIRELELDPYQTIDYAKKLGMNGVQFGGLRGLSETLDREELLAIHQYAKSQGMYCHVSVTTANPVTSKDSFEVLKDKLTQEIRSASYAGWHELHSFMNTSNERYAHPVAWNKHVEGCIKLIHSLRPVLEEHSSRINLEPHGETTFDILKVIEEVGHDIVGVCLDTANTLVNAEDPVLAAKRVAPYTHLTHAKDGMVYFTESGLQRQGKPPGQGVVDWEQVLAVLGEYNPDLSLSIEDHKGLFQIKIYQKDWIDKNPDLTAYELAQVVKLAYQTEKKLANGEIPNVEEYEAIDYLDQMENRLQVGSQYLKGVIKKLMLD